MMRLVQLTDLHISKDCELYNGIDTRQHFHQVLQHCSLNKSDLVVFSGDVAAIEGDFQIYSWVREQIETLPCNVFVIPGNHHNPIMMKRVFDCCRLTDNNQIYGTVTYNDWDIHFLDTSSDSLPTEQIKWLNEISRSTRQSILFMHHPPVKCGVRVIDEKYPLKNRSEAWSCMAQIENLKAVFCGHCHSEDHVYQDNKDIFLTPSTAHQLKENAKSERGWDLDPVPGYREIFLSSDGFSTSTHFLR